MSTQRAEVICDSISPHSHRLTTFKLRYHKFIHGEFMTHRALSRNASSSRAIPVAKLIEEVRNDALRAAPVWWGREQKGMASGDELSDAPSAYDSPEYMGARIETRLRLEEVGPRQTADWVWMRAAFAAADYAEDMVDVGVHKSIVNRIIEPYTHINVIASATDAGWMNFFGLRLDAAAQPEMRALAELMWAVYSESKPKLLQPGEWHLPFVDDSERLIEWTDQCPCFRGVSDPGRHTCGCQYNKDRMAKISVARCARVSYESFETGRRSTVEEDLKLYERLVGAQPMHASPAEHQATPDDWVQRHPIYSDDGMREVGHTFRGKFDHQWGNFTGWRQYRQMLPGQAVAPLPPGYAVK